MTLETLSIDAVHAEPSTQSRVGINEEVVAEYAEAIDAGAIFPPITVFTDGVTYWVADGIHRLRALRRTCIRTVEADVKVGGLRDAILYSLGANAAHGLRRTCADKRKAVRTMLDDEEWSKMSDRALAKALGVGHPFVASIRKPEIAEKQRAREAARSGMPFHPSEEKGLSDEGVKSGAGVERLSTPAAAEPATQPTVATPRDPAPAPGPATTTAAPAAAEPLAFPPGPRDLTPEELMAKDAEETLAELQRLQAIVEADEPLKAALEENKNLRRCSWLAAHMRNNGLMGEQGELIRKINRLERQLKKLGVARVTWTCSTTCGRTTPRRASRSRGRSS